MTAGIGPANGNGVEDDTDLRLDQCGDEFSKHWLSCEITHECKCVMLGNR